MAEYTEVIKQFKRLCAHGNCRTATGCPMNGCNRSQCRKFGFERPREFEQRVMQWAAEHPEPKYPTVYEWLVSVGLLSEDMWSISDLHKPISSEFAQLIGVQPVPVVHCDCGATNEVDARKKLGIEPKGVEDAEYKTDQAG